MKVTVLFFASLREAAGTAELELELVPGTTVAELWQRLSGGMGDLPARVLCAVNQEYVEQDHALADDTREVAFFPPVTGG